MGVLFPFGMILLFEIIFRILGVYEDHEWENQHVAFVDGAKLFPTWDRSLSMPKDPRKLRVFTLGGSSTMGFGVDEPFSNLLQFHLSEKFPDRDVEVVNGGLCAIGSHRVYEVLKRAGDFQPDLCVVYMGHNEFLEEIVYDPRGFATRAERAESVVRALRTVNCIRGVCEDLGLVSGKPKLQKHFLSIFDPPVSKMLKSPEEYDKRLRFLETNVNHMIDFCRAKDIKIIFAPAVPNLLWPPGESTHGSGYRSDPNKWDQLFSEAVRLFDEGMKPGGPDNWNRVIKLCEESLVLDDSYAATHFVLGYSYLVRGNHDRATEHLITANALDKWGDRINHDIADLIISVCDKSEVDSVDLRPVFYRTMLNKFDPSDHRKNTLFLDHCHPSDWGHNIIARELVPMISKGTD